MIDWGLKLRMLMKPYQVADEDEEFVTYQYRPIFIYILYVILAAMFAGIFADLQWLAAGGSALLALFAVTVSIPSLPVHRRIRKAMREDSVEVSGNRWSFTNPLKIKVRKDLS